LSRPHLKMQQYIRILKQKCNSTMIVLCSGQIWWSCVYAPLRKLCHFWPTPKIARENALNRSITQPRIIRFRSNFTQSLNAWHSKCCKSSWSRGQRSRSQGDITCEKFAKLSIIQPRIARFRSNFVQTLITWHLMYHKLSRSTGQKSRSQLDITYQHQKTL